MKAENYQFICEMRDDILSRFNFVSEDIAIFIACLSALETCYGKSVICLENNNYFGMKFPHDRLSTAIKESRGHAFYPSRLSSLCDFFYWLQYHSFSQNTLSCALDSFIRRFRVCHYNESPSYVSSILTIMSNFKSYQNGN